MVVRNRCFAALGWDRAVREVCQTNGIIYQGFWLLTANRAVLGDPKIYVVARGLNADYCPGHLSFYHADRHVALTGTTNEQHMKEDLESDRFALTTEELQGIEAIAL